MYRDGAHLLDEHDRAVCAIQIAEELIDGCVRAVATMDARESPERWSAARTLQDNALEIWQQLDSARAILTARGGNTVAYDELRERITPVLAITYRDGVHGLDADSLDDARRGVAELRLAMPGADWSAIAARTKHLVATSLAQRGQRYALAAIVTLLVIAVAGWAYAIIPEKRIDPRVALRAELAQIVVERRDRIGELQAHIGERCDRAPVHELMKLLVMDGRFDDATAFGNGFTARCGADPIVHKWATAPRPRR